MAAAVKDTATATAAIRSSSSSSGGTYHYWLLPHPEGSLRFISFSLLLSLSLSLLHSCSRSPAAMQANAKQREEQLTFHAQPVIFLY